MSQKNEVREEWKKCVFCKQFIPYQLDRPNWWQQKYGELLIFVSNDLRLCTIITPSIAFTPINSNWMYRAHNSCYNKYRRTVNALKDL